MIWLHLLGHRNGTVDFEVDFKRKKVEPRNEVKGQIARIYFYFQKHYDLLISKKQLKLFTVWNEQYPETKQEREINQKKKQIQGNSFSYWYEKNNPYKTYIYTPLDKENRVVDEDFDIDNFLHFLVLIEGDWII